MTIHWDLWANLEHVDPLTVTKEIYLQMRDNVLLELCKKYGPGVKIQYSVYFSERPGRKKIQTPEGTKYNPVTLNLPLLTVCYIRPGAEAPIDAEVTAVGLTYCNSKDNPNVWYGKAVSLKRAMRAIKGRGIMHHNNFIDPQNDVAALLKKLGADVVCKSFFMPSPTYCIVDRAESVEKDAVA